MDQQLAARDAGIALVASRQHGVVLASQLYEAGLSKDAIDTRVAAGRLHSPYRGVYAVGYLCRSHKTGWMAAVLACCGYGGLAAEDAFLSHRSAAALWGLLPVDRGPVDVAIVGENGRAKRNGIRVHRPRTLEIGMTARHRGIPVTNPQRTISDLRRARRSRGGATSNELRRALRQAAVLGLPLGPGGRPERTRSDLEALFQRICRRHELPAPEVNVRIGTLEVDFLWRRCRLIVETDGYRYHRGRVAFENDHDRDLRLTELGYRVLRFSETQLENEPARVAAAVRRELAAT